MGYLVCFELDMQKESPPGLQENPQIIGRRRNSFHQSNRFVGWYRIRPSEENSKREIEWTACLSSEPSAQLFFCVFFFVIAFACVLLALSPHYLYTLLFDCVVSVKWKNYGRTIALQPNSIILPLW